MQYRLRALRGKYPSQFWLMFFGMLVSTIGSSMVWPFLMIYVTTRLKLPLTTAASLMTINSTVALVMAFIAGPVIDRLGRKWMMVVSLIGLGMVYVFYTQANSYAFTAVLMAMTGLFNPIYRVGADAMMADLIPPDQRPDAYALLRMSNNVGVAIGPTIGGFAAATSYSFAFMGAATGLTLYGVLIALFARETLPALVTKNQPSAINQPLDANQSTLGNVPAERPAQQTPQAKKEPLGGYLRIFADRPFVFFIIAFTLNQVCAALIWVLLSVYAKTNYGLSESAYGFIPMTNALMVVFLQALVTGRTKKRPPLRVLAAGSALYAIATTSVAFGRGFGGFWLSMVVLTFGELMLMPTATTYTANLAPADMRGRYMSVYGLTWNIAQGIGPLAGGFLSDHLGPTAPWLGGGVVGLFSASAFALLATRGRKKADSEQRTAVS